MHGLVVFYRNSRFWVKASKTIYLDDEELDPSASTPRARRGGTRQTKNVALIVALEEEGGHGVVIATTHLYGIISSADEEILASEICLREMSPECTSTSCDLTVSTISWYIALANDISR